MRPLPRKIGKSLEKWMEDARQEAIHPTQAMDARYVEREITRKTAEVWYLRRLLGRGTCSNDLPLDVVAEVKHKFRQIDLSTGDLSRYVSFLEQDVIRTQAEFIHCRELTNQSPPADGSGHGSEEQKPLSASLPANIATAAIACTNMNGMRSSFASELEVFPFAVSDEKLYVQEAATHSSLHIVAQPAVTEFSEVLKALAEERSRANALAEKLAASQHEARHAVEELQQVRAERDAERQRASAELQRNRAESEEKQRRCTAALFEARLDLAEERFRASAQADVHAFCQEEAGRIAGELRNLQAAVDTERKREAAKLEKLQAAWLNEQQRTAAELEALHAALDEEKRRAAEEQERARAKFTEQWCRSITVHGMMRKALIRQRRRAAAEAAMPAASQKEASGITETMKLQVATDVATQQADAETAEPLASHAEHCGRTDQELHQAPASLAVACGRAESVAEEAGAAQAEAWSTSDDANVLKADMAGKKHLVSAELMHALGVLAEQRRRAKAEAQLCAASVKVVQRFITELQVLRNTFDTDRQRAATQLEHHDSSQP